MQSLFYKLSKFLRSYFLPFFWIFTDVEKIIITSVITDMTL